MSTLVLKFEAPWCNQCRSYSPIISRVCKSMNIPLVDVDLESGTINNLSNSLNKYSVEDLSFKYKVLSIPTTVIIDDANPDKFIKIAGYKTDKELHSWIVSSINKLNSVI